MGDGVLRIDQDRYARMSQEVGRRILLRPLALFEDHQHVHTSPVGVNQRLGDRRRGKAVGLDQHGLLGRGKFSYDGVGAAALRAEVDIDLWQ